MGCYFILRELDQALASVLLLGGEISGETNGIEDRILALGEPITLMTIAFLDAITPQRQQILRERLDQRIAGAARRGSP
jgi:hypothetical protein